MHRLKDIAARMDCHPRTAKRWWKRLRIPPDVIGHGPHRWKTATFERLISLWETFYQQRGTTPQLTRAKFAGLKPHEKHQLDLLAWKAPTNEKKFPARTTTKTATAQKRRGAGSNAKT